MANGNEIDLLARLRVKKGKRYGAGKGRLSGKLIEDKATLEWRIPKVSIRADEREFAENFGRFLAGRITYLMLKGVDPGSEGHAPLPASPQATMDRREYRLKQAKRGGSAHPKYAKSGKYKDARWKFNNRYRLQGEPNFPGQPVRGSGVNAPAIAGKFGVESGLLAASARTAVEGGKFRVFFAANRGNIRGGGSAVQRVFGRGRLKPWTQRSQNSPIVQQYLRELAQNMIITRKNKADARKRAQLTALLRSMGQAARNVQNIAGEAEDLAE